MESQDILGCGKSPKNEYPTPDNALADNYTSSNFRNHQNWSNKWETNLNTTESSDYLSQSVTSSASWSDEFEGDVAKTLQEQMKRIENTLYRDGSQQLSARSGLREECRLWQNNFLHLRIVGEAVKPSVSCQTESQREAIEEQIDEIIASHGECEATDASKSVIMNEPTIDSNEVYKENLKKAVIDQIFARIWPEVVKRIEPILKKSAKQGKKKVVSPEQKLIVDNGSCNDGGLTSGFNSFSLVDESSGDFLRTRYGISGVGSRKNVAEVVPVHPVVLKCSIPTPRSVNMRRIPKPPQANLSVKYPSPERNLSPLVLHGEVKSPARSAAGHREGVKQECRQRSQYDTHSRRMTKTNKESSRSGLRRNLKTSPPIPWTKHSTLPPIEIPETALKVLDNKRSASAFFKGGRLTSGSRPSTSKNQVILSPLDSLQIRKSAVLPSRQCLPDNHIHTNFDVLQLKPVDQRQRWQNRTNALKK